MPCSIDWFRIRAKGFIITSLAIYFLEVGARVLLKLATSATKMCEDFSIKLALLDLVQQYNF